MFGNLKDLQKLQSKAKEVQKELGNETIEAENKGVKIFMNGNSEVLSVEINPELSRDDQEKYLKQTFNEANKKVQSLMARKMMGGGMF